jgi:hypothetical protein
MSTNANPAIYALPGPPFNFLGNFSETQHNALVTWVTGNTPSLPKVQTFYQIRAQQLRKTAGILETFYASGQAPDKLAPTFVKAEWKPAEGGHFPYGYRLDHEPAMVVGKVKEYFRSRLVTQDDAVFHLNQVRVMIEKQEDLATYQNEASTKVPQLMSRIVTLFQKPENEAVLIKDISEQYQGEARFRSSQLDKPTLFEKQNRTGHTPTSSPTAMTPTTTTTTTSTGTATGGSGSTTNLA